MKRLLGKLYKLVDKIGKVNFTLIIFVFVMVLVIGLYSTFSLYTTGDGISILDGLKTYKFILNSENITNSVTVAAGSSKNVAITVSNEDNIKLKYGIYYTSNDDLKDVSLGYLEESSYLPNGVIEPNKDYVVTIKIYNDSLTNVTINFGLLYGLEFGGDLTLEENQYWLGQVYNRIYLSEVSSGSYVAYRGNNGCIGETCLGYNQYYIDDTNMGYCNDSNNKFSVSGWRVGYIKNGSAYLISASSPDCMCTNQDGTLSNGSCSTKETTNGAPLHLANLNKEALIYCNQNYAYGGVCNSDSAWNMNVTDFKEITGSVLSSSSCLHTSDGNCGKDNDLIDNGGYYWLATSLDSSSDFIFAWEPNNDSIGRNYSNFMFGLRPVLKLATDVMVYGGTGTYEDPYIINYISDSGVQVVAKKMTSATTVSSRSWSDEGLVFAFNQTDESLENIQVYYCQDRDNTCIPNQEAGIDNAITNYQSLNGIYYFRYKVVTSDGASSQIFSYIAKVDTTTPVITMTNKEVEINQKVSLADVSYGPSSGSLSCIDSSNNNANVVNSFSNLGLHTVNCTVTTTVGRTATASATFTVSKTFMGGDTSLAVKSGAYKEGDNIVLPKGGIQYGPYWGIAPGCYRVTYTGNNLNAYPEGYKSYNSGTILTLKNLTYSSSNAEYVVKIPTGSSDRVEFVFNNESTSTVTISKLRVVPISDESGC